MNRLERMAGIAKTFFIFLLAFLKIFFFLFVGTRPFRRKMEIPFKPIFPHKHEQD